MFCFQPALTGRVLCRSDDESENDFPDRGLDNLMIVTQTPPPSRLPTRPDKHEGHDRTGDYISRVKMTQDLASAINDGLFYYERDLWDQPEWVSGSPARRSRFIAWSSHGFWCKIAPLCFSMGEGASRRLGLILFESYHLLAVLDYD